MLKATNVRLPLGEEEAQLAERLARRLRVLPNDLRSLRILRKSLDIRDKRRLEYVYTVAVELEDEASVLRRRPDGVSGYEPTVYEPPVPGERPLEHRPVVVGAGPAGLFAAYVLAEHGYQPLLLERGKEVRERIKDVEAFDQGGPLDPESNYLFGEGGAGTFSDGKLTCRSSGSDVQRVLEIIAACKGKPSILYEARPHLGSNRLPAVVKAIRRRIVAMGGEVRFRCRVDDLDLVDGRVQGLITPSGRIATNVIVLAIGHSARDTYAMLLRRGIALQTKPFQMGLRIEQPQEPITAHQYGTSPQAKLLGPADYTLKVHVGSDDLFTFCMCAGGYVMPSVSQPGYFCTNGMSRARHESPFANSGLVTTVEPDCLDVRFGADALRGVRFQQAIEQMGFALGEGNYLAPIQRAADFLAGRVAPAMPPSSYRRGVRPADLRSLLPGNLPAVFLRGLVLMDRQWHGRFLQDATLVGPETRGSSPLRIVRRELDRESISTEGLFPVGEGAGYAGGIVSAAVDGLRTAKAIIRRFRPLCPK